MSFELSIFGLVSFASSTTAIVSGLALRLLDSSENAKTYWLSIWLGTIGLSSATQFLAELGLFSVIPISIVITAGIPFLTGPAIYAYLSVVLGDAVQSRRVFSAIAVVGLLLAVLWWRSIDRDGHFLTPESMLLAVVFYSLTIGYLIATIRKILVFRRSAPDRFSNLQASNLTWLSGAGIAYIAVLLIDIALGYFLASARIEVHAAGAILSSALTVFVASLSFFALRQPIALRENAVKSHKKYASSALSGKELGRLSQRLDVAMVDERLFLDCDLNLVSLADELNVGRHHLSQLINQEFGMNFYRYINRFRIEHAKNLLIQSDLSVLQVAFECGYNNKASFYKAFRDLCGKTPNAYRNSGGDQLNPDNSTAKSG